jgi:hypothetical protein
MKTKLFIASLLLSICVSVSLGATKFSVPLSVEGVRDPGLASAGLNNVVMVTSTMPALATDAAGATITEGFVYWIAMSTSCSVYLVMRATNTANLTSTLLMPYIGPIGSAGAAATNMTTFNPPIPFSNGLSLNLGVAGSTPAVGKDNIAVGVRWKNRQ